MAQGAAREIVTIDAIGPETFTFRDLVRTIGSAIGKPRPILSVPPVLGHAAGRLLGAIVGDIMITRAEIEGLMAGLLYVESPPAGDTRFTERVRLLPSTLGVRYASELGRRRGRTHGYRGEA